MNPLPTSSKPEPYLPSTPPLDPSPPAPALSARMERDVLSHPEEQKKRPSLLFLIPILIGLLITGGLFAWLRRDAAPAPRPVAVVPPSLVPGPLPAPMAAPERVSPPNRRAPSKRPASIAPEPGSERPPAPLGAPVIRATFGLEQGGDPSVINVDVYSDDHRWSLRGLHPNKDGTLTIEPPRGAEYSMLATAPGHAFRSVSLDLEHGHPQDPVIVLERAKRFELSAVELAPATSDGPPPQVEPVTAQAGVIWRGIEFSQRDGELFAMGKTCVCIRHSLGDIPLSALESVKVPAGKAERCFFAMKVGEAFLVRTQPEGRWIGLRLRAPGIVPTSTVELDLSTNEPPRRVFKPASAQR